MCDRYWENNSEPVSALQDFAVWWGKTDKTIREEEVYMRFTEAPREEEHQEGEILELRFRKISTRREST